MFQNKARKRFMEKYEPVHGRFERFCNARSYGVMDAKDLMHDAIVVALEKFKMLDEQASFLSFLCGIAVRILANQRRKMMELSLNEQAFEQGTKPNSETELAIAELYEALARLPEPISEALILFEITGFSIKEIAGLQDCSQDAVKQRLVRGRKQLAGLLKDEPLLTEAK